MFRLKYIVSFCVLMCGAITAAAPKTYGALENLNVGFGSISGIQLPLWIAKERGLFEKQGLGIELVYLPGGPRTLMALLGGSIQLVNYSATQTISANLRGADTVIIGSSINKADHSLIVKPGINTVRDLRGKIIGVSSLGSIAEILFSGSLRLEGLAEREVKIVAVGGLSERVSALQTGRIDGAMLLGEQMLAATKLGFKELIDFSKLPFEVSLAALVSTRSFILKQPETALKFLRAWVEGIFLFKSNRDLSLDVLKKYTRIEDRDLLQGSYTRYRDVIEMEPFPSISAVKSMLAILARTQPEAANADPHRFVEMKLMASLSKSGFFEKMKSQYPTVKK